MRSRSPASASATWPGSVVSSTVSAHARGGGDHLGGERRAAHPGEHDAVDALGMQARVAQRLDLADQRARALCSVGPRQPDRRLGLGLRSPQRGVLRGELRRHAGRRRAVDQQLPGRLGERGVGDARPSCRSAISSAAFADVELAPDRVEQLGPRLLELLDALVLEHAEHVVEVDADLGEAVEHLLRLRGGAGDRVAVELAVVGDGLQGLLRHRVDGVGDDQLGRRRGCPE